MAAEQDKRLGKIGGEDTKVCAKTGMEATAGMVRVSLGDGWYFRVLPKAVRLVDEAFIAEMKALIPASPVEKVAKKVEATKE